MTTPTATTPAQLMNAIFTDFSKWAKGRKGRVYVAKDLEHAMTLLADTPSGWAGVLHWEGDEPAGSGTRRGGVVENNLKLFVKAGMGLSAEPSIALIRPTAARTDPILDLLDMVRFRMLQYRFPGVRAPGDVLSHKGTSDQANVSGFAVAVYNLTFGIWTAVKMPAETDMIDLNKGE